MERSKIVFFSTGGGISLWTRPADIGAARLARQGIARGPAPRDSRPRPSPVVGAAHSQGRKNGVSFAGDPSASAVPSRLRETRSATPSFRHSPKKQGQSIPCILPMKNDLPYDSSINTLHVHVTRESHPSMCTHHAAAAHAGWLPVRDDAPCSSTIRVVMKHRASHGMSIARDARCNSFLGAALCTHRAKVQTLCILNSLLARKIEKVHVRGLLPDAVSSTYEYWCCWCCCTYRVVSYDPSLVVASFVASLSRSSCSAESSNG